MSDGTVDRYSHAAYVAKFRRYDHDYERLVNEYKDQHEAAEALAKRVVALEENDKEQTEVIGGLIHRIQELEDIQKKMGDWVKERLAKRNNGGTT